MQLFLQLHFFFAFIKAFFTFAEHQTKHTMKTQLTKVHFEFTDGDTTHTVSYVFDCKVLLNGQRVKQFSVHYGQNGKYFTRLGWATHAPNQTNAAEWLKLMTESTKPIN